MTINEFDVIQKYFQRQHVARDDVILGIGDDAAVVTIPANQQLVITTDTLVSGIHFFSNAQPTDIAHKALAVNLSDLAAMAAKPAWATLSLTLPRADETWLTAFRHGFFELADRYQLQLIGGDMSHGPLSITIQTCGFTDPEKAVFRSGAKPGDFIYVTGTLGIAGFILDCINKKKQLSDSHWNELKDSLFKPQPRVNEALAMADFISAMIDISDGLAADLGHILQNSHVGARLQLADIPLSNNVLQYSSHEEALAFALNSGDDYELCCTVPSRSEADFITTVKAFSCGYKKIGIIEQESGLRAIDTEGKLIHLPERGYSHF